jgi:hypothetical protein
VGQARLSPERSAGSANRIDLYLRRHLPETGHGRGSDPARLQHRGTEALNLHLAEIAKAVAPGAHAVLFVDQAGWHLSARLLIPANITVLALPPKCPELNPVKNIWQYMRDNWLSNRVFKSYDDIVDHCCYAWNTLVDRPWKIMSIGLRQWAHGF